MIKLNPELRRLSMKQIKTADPINYIRWEAKKIREYTENIELPKLSTEEVNHLKRRLQDFNKVKGEEIQYKFLNLRNAFLIINEMEEDTEVRERIHPILEYIHHYKPIIDLIIQNQGKDKEDSKLTLAIQLLNLEITVFISKYRKILIDIDTSELTETTTLKKIQIENINTEEEEEYPKIAPEEEGDQEEEENA